MNGLLHTKVRHRVRAGIIAALLVPAGILIPACFVGATLPAARIELGISKFAFAPKEITVTPGTTIVWTNHDEAPHTVASSDKTFASKGLDTDDKFAHTFNREGDFDYICTVHPFMTGTVHVRKR